MLGYVWGGVVGHTGRGSSLASGSCLVLCGLGGVGYEKVIL